jgi:hypothetical protein
VVILIFLILAALPIWLQPELYTQPELHWMVVGERLNGGALMYVDLWDETGPLAAYVYGWVDFLFGRSVISYRVLGIVLIFFQAAYFNVSLLRNKILTENNYVPALVYAILAMMTFNGSTLSPALMGMTFIIPAIDNLFFHLQSRIKFDAPLGNIGILTGLATLFYLPYLYFMVIWFVALLLYSATISRRYLLMFYGFFFVLFILWIYYVWKGEANKLFIDYFFSLFRDASIRYLPFTGILIILAFPVVVFIVNLLVVYNQPGYTNYQSRVHSFFLLTIITMMPVWLLYSDHSANNLIFFIPGMSFFIAQGFVLFRKRWKREAFFAAFFIWVLAFNYATFYDFFGMQGRTGLTEVMIKKVHCPVPIEGKSILVVGNDINYYARSRQATPYLEWRLARMQLEQLQYYDNVVDIYKNFRDDMPEVIIDLENVMKNVFEKIPPLQQKYLLADKKGIYVINEEN